MMAFVACRLLFFATTREREREKDTSSFFRDDAFRVFSKRGIKNSIVLQKMMRKR
jgi:hypothetical protein